MGAAPQVCSSCLQTPSILCRCGSATVRNHSGHSKVAWLTQIRVVPQSLEQGSAVSADMNVHRALLLRSRWWISHILYIWKTLIVCCLKLQYIGEIGILQML